MPRKDNRAHRTLTVSRAIRQRARSRASLRLQKAYPELFQLFLNEELQKARVEVELLAEVQAAQTGVVAAGQACESASSAAPPAAAAAPTSVETPVEPVVLLRPGQRKQGETALDRVARPDVGNCPYCIKRHDRDHVCPVCNSKPQVAPVVRRADVVALEARRG